MTVDERALTICENCPYIYRVMIPEHSLPVPSRKLSALFSYLQERGVDPNRFVGDLESKPEAWRDSEFSIPLDLWFTLCRSAAESLNDPDFGLGLGRNFWGMPTMLGHLMAACRNLREALESYIQYQEIELHSWRLEMKEGQDTVALCFVPVTSIARDRLILDFVMSSFMGTAKRLTGRDLNIKKASFCYPEPENHSLHGMIFPGLQKFGSPVASLTVLRSELETPVRTASREVRQLLEKSLEKALYQLNSERKYTFKALEAVTRFKGGISPDIQSVARDLVVGIRDLQLKLKQEGTTFRKIKESSQTEMALDYLRNTALGIKEIAYILGFSDSRAFHRAFYRWTGKTPGEVKKEFLAREEGK